MSFLEALGIKINTNIKIDTDPDLQARPESQPPVRTGHEFYKHQSTNAVSSTQSKTTQTESTSVVAHFITTQLVFVLQSMKRLGVSFYWEDKNEELHELTHAVVDSDNSVIFTNMDDFDDNINYLSKKNTKISPLAIYGLVNSFGTELCDVFVGSIHIDHGAYVISGPQLIKDGSLIFTSLFDLAPKPKGLNIGPIDDIRMTLMF